MFILQKLRKTVARIDMFSSSQLLRYNEDAYYQTFTGGIITLGIIVTVISGFFSMISETINRTAITSTVNALTTSNPPAYNLTANTDNMFMFGIQIQSTDLSFFYDINGPRRYFDVTVMQIALNYGIIQVAEVLPMVQCTDQHWKMLPDIVNNKDLTFYNTWLCPPIDSEYLLQGSFFSQIYASLMITVSKCTNESDPSRPCYPQNEIDDLFTHYGNFYYTVNYINTVINPSEVQYRSYYLEPMDYVIFSANTGSEVYYLFSDYQIETDTSIWPFSSYQIDTGALIPLRASGKPYMMDGSGSYVITYFSKSAQSLYYRRQVQKLSVVFSYIGGLVGAISALLFIMKIYTDSSFQLSIARNLFSHSENQEYNEKAKSKAHNFNTTQISVQNQNTADSSNSFNLITFIKLSIFRVLKGFKFTQNWKEPKQLEMLKQEISKHLDVKILLQRVLNLQRSLSFLYDEDQLKCIKYQKKNNLKQVKKLRTIFSNEIQSDEDQLEESSSINHLYKIQSNKIQSAKESQNNQFQFVSPENLSNIGNTFPINDSQNIKNIERIDSRRQSEFNQNQLNRHVLSKKMIDYFSNLRQMKQTDVLSKHLWQNLNEKIKEDIVSDIGKGLIQGEAGQNIHRKSYLMVSLPSMIINRSE